MRIVLCCYVSSFLWGTQDAVTGLTEEDFIFVAEIPVHGLLKPTSDEDWIENEREYMAKKGSVIQLRPEGPEDFYEVARTKESGNTWRGRFTPYKNLKPKNRQEPLVEGIEREARKIIDLFRKEAFSCSDQESIPESEKRMRIVVLANDMKSIFAFHNQPLKTVWNETEYSNVCLLRGAWEPKWVRKKTKNSKGVPVSLKEVRQYMRFCLDKTINGTDAEKEKYREVLYQLVEQEKKGGDQVPYHELREYIRVAPERNAFVQSFVNSNLQATLYEATHDSDLVGLRVQSDGSSQNPTGLYTHYLHILQDETKEPPDVLTTGYRAAPDNRFKSISDFGWVYTAIEGERYTRAAAANVDYRAAYIPEPNCLFRVPKGGVSIQESFCNLPTGKSLEVSWETSKKRLLPEERNKYAPCESPAIMVQRYANSEEREKLKVFFDPTHPVFMKVPKRMLAYESYSELGTYFAGRSDDHFNRAYGSDEKLLCFLNNISQSCFNSFMQGKIIYRQFGLNGKNFYVGSFASRVGRLVETLKEWSEKQPDSCHRFLSILACPDFNTFKALSEQDQQLRVVEAINRVGLQFILEEGHQAIEGLIARFMVGKNTEGFNPFEFYKSLISRGNPIKNPHNLFASLYYWMLDMHILPIVNPVKSRGLVPYNLRCVLCTNDPTTLQFGNIKLNEQKENIRGIELAHSFFSSSESRMSFFVRVFFDPEAKTFLYTRAPSEGEIPSWLKNSLASFLYDNLQKIMNEIYGPNVGTILRRAAEEMGCARQDFYSDFFPIFGSIAQSKTSPKKAVAQLELSGYENPFIHQPNPSAVEYSLVRWLISLIQPSHQQEEVKEKVGQKRERRE